MASLEFLPKFSQNKITVWGWLFTCVVYTKTIIHLSVGEKWWIFTSNGGLLFYNIQITGEMSNFSEENRKIEKCYFQII